MALGQMTSHASVDVRIVGVSATEGIPNGSQFRTQQLVLFLGPSQAVDLFVETCLCTSKGVDVING